MDNSASIGPSKDQSSVYFETIFLNNIYYAVPISRDWIHMVQVGVKVQNSNTAFLP
jgi:hypothetical protein